MTAAFHPPAEHPGAARLHGVAATCLLTLNARARESQRSDALFSDPEAEEALRRLGLDTRRFDRDWLTLTGVAIRTEILDEAARTFALRHPDGWVVNLGAGLCTRIFRLRDASLRWIDVDASAVLDLRRSLLRLPPHCHLVAGSALDAAWRTEARSLAGDRPVLIIAEGLLQYLTSAEVHRLVVSLATDFPTAEALLETVSPLAAAASRWQPSLRALGLRVRSSPRDEREMEGWSPRIRVLETLYYDRHLARWRWLRWFRNVPAIRKLMRIVHVRFQPLPTRCPPATH